jgi:translation elongation factor EF-Ts
MVEGSLRKYFEDFVVMDQTFVMNDTMKVKVCETSLILLIELDFMRILKLC